MIRVGLAEPKSTGGVGLELEIASYDELGLGDKERSHEPNAATKNVRRLADICKQALDVQRLPSH
jgi:hypothetical protein